MSNNNERISIVAVFDGNNAVAQAGKTANEISQKFGGADITGGMAEKFGFAGQQLSKLGVIGGTVAAGLAVSFAGVSAAINFGDKINEIREFAAAAGMIPAEFEATAKALQLTGWSSEQAADKLKDINERFGEFKTRGTGALADVLKDWNILASDLNSTDNIKNLDTIVRKMKEQGASAQEVHFALGEIVDDGQVLTEVMGDNATKFNKTKDAAMATAKATDENVKNAKEFKEATQNLESAWGNVTAAVGSALLPKITDAINETAAWIASLQEAYGWLMKSYNAQSNLANSQSQAAQDYKNGVGLRGGYANGALGANGSFNYGGVDPNVVNAALGETAPSGTEMSVNDERRQSQSSRRFNQQAERNAAAAAQRAADKARTDALMQQNKNLTDQITIAKNLNDDAKVNALTKQLEKNNVDLDVLSGKTDAAMAVSLKASIEARVDKAKKSGSKNKSAIEEANEAYAKGMAENKRLLDSHLITQATYNEREQVLANRKADAIGEANAKLTGQEYVSIEKRKELLKEWGQFYAENIAGEGNELLRQFMVQKQSFAEQEAELERHLKAQLDAKLMSAEQAQQMRDGLRVNQGKSADALIEQQLGVSLDGPKDPALQDYEQANGLMDGMTKQANDEYTAKLESAKGNLDQIRQIEEEHALTMQGIDEKREKLRTAIDKKYQEERLANANQAFNGTIAFMKLFGKKSAGLVKTMVVMQTITNQVKVISDSWAGISAATARAAITGSWWEVPIAKAAFAGSILGAIASVASAKGINDNVDGQAHDGYDSLPSDGTWNLQKGERVTDARTNADLKNYLKKANTAKNNNGSVVIQAGVTIQGDVYDNFDERLNEAVERQKESLAGIVHETTGRMGLRN